jgi:hypothetical protein
MMSKENDTPSIPIISARKTQEKDIILDDKGFFVIELFDTTINVEFYRNVIKDHRIVSGKLHSIFKGTSAAALCDTIGSHITDLRPEHYLYLGRELMKAEWALTHDEPYDQDGC